jgi:hypothetical protein
MPQSITWEPLFRQWPGAIEARQDPGDIASADCGTRSRTVLECGADKAQFSCAHLRVTVDVDTGDRPPLSERDLARLALYLAYQGHTCDCFRAAWRKLTGGKKFCRAAAIEAWSWLEDRVGCWNVYPMWFERVPHGEEYRGRGEVVHDGLSPDPSWVRRLLRAWRNATKAQRERSIVGGTLTGYPVYTLDEFLALDDSDLP